MHGSTTTKPVTAETTVNRFRDTEQVAIGTLEALRAQYLAETFGLPSDTALLVAELVFGNGDAP